MTDRDEAREYLDEIDGIDRDQLDPIQKGLIQETLNIGAHEATLRPKRGPGWLS